MLFRSLALVAALAMQVGRSNTKIIGKVPATGIYLDRMGLYGLTSTESPFTYKEKESAGRSSFTTSLLSLAFLASSLAF